ncbi:MAG: HNH endonuclease [Acidobacteria bacterium RIFCSPLOWO2_12_FULL_54_10]|nr:MAG: HNH endonuclease [Acidobacteria bacterium RIFCSPLOWO2_12_FULL_54_10]
MEKLEAKRNGQVLHTPVLVLNATYEPVNVCAARRAIVLILNGVALPEEVSHRQVKSPSRIMQVPSVIRLLEYRRIPHQARALSRKNILIRDHYTCQFCARTLVAAELTLDHIIPRSQGGKSAWENLVACCYSCNNHKGDRTPEQASMKLLRQPRPFNLHTSRHLMRLMASGEVLWRKYLFF